MDNVVTRFRAMVRRSADSTALAWDGGAMTYAELDRRANGLARRLVERGVAPENNVAVLMGRTADLIVAFLAVLRTGAAYLPLDLRSPSPRLELMMKGADPTVVLVDAATHERDIATGDPRVLRADTVPPDDAEAPDVAVHEDQLAYVMHTSGTTGVPKGVAVTHRNLVDLAVDGCWGVDHHSRVLFHAPHAFDASDYEIWVPLLAGGTVVIAPDVVMDAAAIRTLIRRAAITHVHVTAGLFRVIAEDDPSCFAGVREILTGGDVVSAMAVRRVRAACPDAVIRVLYGPTETTLCATQHQVRGTGGPLPLGVPLDGTRVHLLDATLREVAAGADGEVYIAGAGVVRGYLGRPGTTAERFVPDPFGPPGARMYRTGDLGRWRADGGVDFLGRGDDQVKIRGFRVELSEVERALAGHRDVAEVAVVARADAELGNQVVAYVIPANDVRDLPGELRRLAARTLPDYMVPAAVVPLPVLPLTPNGKLDRQALPWPAATGSRRAPRTPVERTLCALFGELLRVDAVGVDDSFFDLGGHSLLAAQLVTRVRAVFGVPLMINTVMRAPTPLALAGLIESGMADRRDQGADRECAE